MRILATGRSRNSQTGDVPTVTIGRTKQEMRTSCAHSGCDLFVASMKARTDKAWAKANAAGSIRCYAWDGTPNMAAQSKAKKHARGGDTSLRKALDDRLWSSRMVRVSDLGDISWLTEDEACELLDTIEGEGLTPIGYTHGWKRSPWLKGRVMASVRDGNEFLHAWVRGWGCTVILPADHDEPTFTIRGVTGTVCPTKLGEPIDCNSCLKCDGTGLIGFPRHDHYGRSVAKGVK